MPPSPRDWLGEDHLAFFVSDTVDALDLSAFYERYEGDGRRNQPFDPRMMVKLLVYGYATGTFSSRKIAQKLQEDVAFRVLGPATLRLTGRLRSFVNATWESLSHSSSRWFGWPLNWV
jgi:hypothetical protein